jgi:7,8-dihydropterin-6-yl-methyl-4-(beta-D-ribofuranosyl)aminobenzene 5'-phosphate synthase
MLFPKCIVTIAAVIIVVFAAVCSGRNSNTIQQQESEVAFDPKTSLRMTILYDNYAYLDGTQTDWGFACLIEGTEKTILFDTGTKPDILFHNIEKMNVDLNEVDVVVISHSHGDHTGGLLSVLDRNPNVTVYLPRSTPPGFVRNVEAKGAGVVLVRESVGVCRDVSSTGEMGVSIREQSLVLKTKQGIVVITGCAHPGIVDIVQKAREIIDEDIPLVFGGFHLMNHSDEAVQEIIGRFRELGVKKCGATHCTGDRQIELFKNGFGEDYVRMGTGRILVIPK